MGVSLWTVQMGATKYIYGLSRSSDFLELDYCSSVSAIMQLFYPDSDVTCAVCMKH